LVSAVAVLVALRGHKAVLLRAAEAVYMGEARLLVDMEVLHLAMALMVRSA